VNLDLEAAAAHLVDDAGKALGGGQEKIEVGQPRRGHSPLKLGLGLDHGRVQGGRGTRGDEGGTLENESSATFHVFPPLT
jgi:hypothetical protein